MDRRTKNRLREHPQLVAVERRDSVPALNGRSGTLFRCTCHADAWLGWLPTDQLPEEDA